MAIRKTSILVLFLGAATLFFLAAAEAAIANRPVTVGPVTVRPAPPVINNNNVCKKVEYPQICEVTVKHKNDPVRALMETINRAYILARQAKILYLEKMDEKMCSVTASMVQDDLASAKQALLAKKFDRASYHLGTAIALSECEEPDVDLPPPLEKIIPALTQMWSNSYVLSLVILGQR